MLLDAASATLDTINGGGTMDCADEAGSGAGDGLETVADVEVDADAEMGVEEPPTDVVRDEPPDSSAESHSRSDELVGVASEDVALEGIGPTAGGSDGADDTTDDAAGDTTVSGTVGVVSLLA